MRLSLRKPIHFFNSVDDSEEQLGSAEEMVSTLRMVGGWLMLPNAPSPLEVQDKVDAREKTNTLISPLKLLLMTPAPMSRWCFAARPLCGAILP
eukprot:13346243-Ditylum_brightwellii.AAC.1